MAAADLIFEFFPENDFAPLTNPATPDERNRHLVLDFDSTTSESALFRGIIPSSYGGGNLTVTMLAAMTSATSGNVGIDVSFENDDSQDIDADGFAALTSSTATAVNATSGVLFPVTVTVTAGANLDSLVAGKPFRCKVSRNVGVASNASGDMELWSIRGVEA